jgi:DNA-binding protein WhiA
MKVIASSNEHIQAIELLIKYDRFEKLDSKLKEVAILRQLHPEASLNELAQLYSVQSGTLMSKSGMKHRFNKLIELSKPLKEKEVK